MTEKSSHGQTLTMKHDRKLTPMLYTLDTFISFPPVSTRLVELGNFSGRNWKRICQKSFRDMHVKEVSLSKSQSVVPAVVPTFMNCLVTGPDIMVSEQYSFGHLDSVMWVFHVQIAVDVGDLPVDDNLVVFRSVKCQLLLQLILN